MRKYKELIALLFILCLIGGAWFMSFTHDEPKPRIIIYAPDSIPVIKKDSLPEYNENMRDMEWEEEDMEMEWED